MAMLNCLQITGIQYLMISFIGDIYLKYLGTWVGCEFLEFVFHNSFMKILYIEYPFWHLYGRTY